MQIRSVNGRNNFCGIDCVKESHKMWASFESWAWSEGSWRTHLRAYILLTSAKLIWNSSKIFIIVVELYVSSVDYPFHLLLHPVLWELDSSAVSYDLLVMVSALRYSKLPWLLGSFLCMQYCFDLADIKWWIRLSKQFIWLSRVIFGSLQVRPLPSIEERVGLSSPWKNKKKNLSNPILSSNDCYHGWDGSDQTKKKKKLKSLQEMKRVKSIHQTVWS